MQITSPLTILRGRMMTPILQMRKVRLRMGRSLVVEIWLESGHPGTWILDDISPTLDTEARPHAIISSRSCPQNWAASLGPASRGCCWRGPAALPRF